MDTRTKIIKSDEAAKIAAGGATVVSGFFDPLIASHARKLTDLKNGKPLLVLIATPGNPILSFQARAELVASLRAVDYVAEFTPAIPLNLNLGPEDELGKERLIQHVHARQGATS